MGRTSPWTASAVAYYSPACLYLQMAIALRTCFPLSVLLFDRFAVSRATGQSSWCSPFSISLQFPSVLFGILLDGPLPAPRRCSYSGGLTKALNWFLALIAKMLRSEPRLQLRELLQLSGLMTCMSACISAPLSLLYCRSPGRDDGSLPSPLPLSFHTGFKPASPLPGCLDYTVLDVGSGTRCPCYRPARHTLLFDTGPSFRNGNDVGSARDTAISPYVSGIRTGSTNCLSVMPTLIMQGACNP